MILKFEEYNGKKPVDLPTPSAQLELLVGFLLDAVDAHRERLRRHLLTSPTFFYLVPLSLFLSGPTFTFLYLVPYSLFWSSFHFLLFGLTFNFFYPLSLLYILLRQFFPPFTFYWHYLCCSKFTFSVVLLSTVSSFVYHLNLSKNSCQITLFPLLAHMCPSSPFPVFAFA